jgi:hypothetical protein
MNETDCLHEQSRASRVRRRTGGDEMALMLLQEDGKRERKKAVTNPDNLGTLFKASWKYLWEQCKEG